MFTKSTVGAAFFFSEKIFLISNRVGEQGRRKGKEGGGGKEPSIQCVAQIKKKTSSAPWNNNLSECHQLSHGSYYKYL